MQVETYEVNELIGEQLEDISSEEALELIETLGLEGQQSLISSRDVSNGDSVVTRNPYPVMTAEEQRVFQACFPKETKLREYASSSIPLRVLQVAAHAKQIDSIKSLWVWHPEDARTDPLLVGYTGDSRYSRGVIYKLARWGDSLLPFEELREKARLILETKLSNEIAKAESDLSALKHRVSQAVAAHLMGNSADIPYFSISL